MKLQIFGCGNCSYLYLKRLFKVPFWIEIKHIFELFFKRIKIKMLNIYCDAHGSILWTHLYNSKSDHKISLSASSQTSSLFNGNSILLRVLASFIDAYIIQDFIVYRYRFNKCNMHVWNFCRSHLFRHFAHTLIHAHGRLRSSHDRSAIKLLVCSFNEISKENLGINENIWYFSLSYQIIKLFRVCGENLKCMNFWCKLQVKYPFRINS